METSMDELKTLAISQAVLQKRLKYNMDEHARLKVEKYELELCLFDNRLDMCHVSHVLFKKRHGISANEVRKTYMDTIKRYNHYKKGYQICVGACCFWIPEEHREKCVPSELTIEAFEIQRTALHMDHLVS